MAQDNAKIAAIRTRLIELLDECDFFIDHAVEREAKHTLAIYKTCQSQYVIIDFILDLLQDGFPMVEVELNNEKYCPGNGYVMKRPYGYDIYIKLKIDESASRDRVHIMSFHPERP